MSDTYIKGRRLADTTYEHIWTWANGEDRLLEIRGCGWPDMESDTEAQHRARTKAFHKLDLIAAYLNEGWVPGQDGDWFEISYYPGNGFLAHYIPADTSTLPVPRVSLIQFKCGKRGKKAIELMGDDLYTLFNIPKP